jgi:electron transfer flavoprotein beta subunit
MLNIIVCFKWVVDEAYIRQTASGELDFSSVDFKIGEYDRNAIEEAVRLRETHGGNVTAITAGSPEAAKGIKDALSRGADRAFFISDPSYKEIEPSQTAALLAAAIGTGIQYDLIICGEGSSDFYAQQVGPRTADCLGIPCISFVQKIKIENGSLIAESKTEDGVEVMEAPFPALITVLPEINTPRIPGVKDTLMAGKKPVVNVKKEELPEPGESRLKTIGMVAARMNRVCEKFGTDDAEIQRFLDTLRKKGVAG